MTQFSRFVCTLCIVLVASCGSSQDANQLDETEIRTSADWVLTSGRIYTVDAHSTWSEAVAIADGKFVYVGNNAGARRFITDDTRKVDLAGQLVIPGLIDGHTHPAYIDLENYGAVLSGTSKDEILSAISDYASTHPDDEWIRLYGWPNNLYVSGTEGPHKRDLDAIVPDRPVWITSVPWHSYWLNSAALEKLGVDKDTPDPLPGVAMYARDEAGELTGWVKEGAGWQHLASQFNVDTAVHEKGVTEFLNGLSESGVTTVYDGGNFGYEDLVYDFLSRLEKAGALPLRYEGTYQIFTPERRALAIPEMKRLQEAYGGERLRFRTIKLFMDGVNENRSAAMLKPYIDHPGYVGNTMLNSEELRQFLLELNEEKFDLHIHTIGDRAVRTVLDGVEAAKASVRGDFYPRVTIAHLEVIDPLDIQRIKDLGITANFTPWWFGASESDSVANAALGEERSSRTYVAKSLSDIGARVTFSSDDWTLNVLSPFLGMQVGQTRQFPKEWSAENGEAGPESRPPASERLDLEDMIRGYTTDGAYPFRLEDQIGSIEPGKLADLIVFEADLFTLDRTELHKVKPAAVMMEGELIHGELR